MARPSTDDTDGLTVADVMHDEFGTMAATVTVGEARAWFAASRSRRLALVADGSRYVGSLTPADVAGELAADSAVGELARPGRTVAPDAPAAVGLSLVLAAEAKRVPVVDADGRLHGVLAVTSDLRHFACRDRASPDGPAH